MHPPTIIHIDTIMTDEELEQAKAIMDILKYDIEIDRHGNKFYYQHGKYHRVDGPAVEYAGGTNCYYQHGEIHRDDGPAIEYADGTNCYYQHDKRHRDDGPAIEYAGGYRSWWLNDVEVDPF
jgi:hypothetical protein